MATDAHVDDRRSHAPSAASEPWSDIASCVDRLAALGVLSHEYAADLAQKIATQYFDLVVAGQFKRGKTSLINALIGAELLPVAVVPLTSVITVLSYGPTLSVTIVHESGEHRPIALDDLAAFVTERGNPNNVKRVRDARVACPSPWLARGIRLIDTPGVGSVYESNTDVTQRYLPKSDAVLFVLSVDQPLSAAERDFLMAIRPYAVHIFFLLNKADLLTESELRESLDFTRSALKSTLGSEPELFDVSARLAVQAAISGLTDVRSGMERFSRALDTFLSNEKKTALAMSVSHKLARAIDESRFSAELELGSLAVPLEALTRKAEHFRTKKDEILRARDDLEILLGHDAARTLQAPLEHALAEFKERLKRVVSQELDRHYESSRRRPSRELDRSLEAEAIRVIRDEFDRWQLAQSEVTDAAFNTFCARHAERVDRIVDELYRFAADLFSLADPARPHLEFRAIESHFHYKFWSEPPALQTLGSAALIALPRMIGARLLLERARRHALELVEAQSGRLRYDFSQRIDQALGTFRRAMSDRITATVGAMEAAIDKALALRHSGESDARRRRDELNANLRTLDEIGQKILRAVSANADHSDQAFISAPAATPTARQTVR